MIVVHPLTPARLAAESLKPTARTGILRLLLPLTALLLSLGLAACGGARRRPLPRPRGPELAGWL